MVKENSQDERRAVEILKRDTLYENGRYTVPLPWKDSRPTIPDDLEYASKRIQCLKKKFDRTPELREKYVNIMNDHIRKGYIERVNSFSESDRKDSWFLPHHPVINPKKTGRVRVVFDCAARFGGVCLNDCLLSAQIHLLTW